MNRFVVPAPPLGHWWTVPVLLLAALEAALVEEVIVLGYLVTRLRQLSWSPVAAVAGSSLLRGVLPPLSGGGAASSATWRWVCCSRSCSCGGDAPGRS